MDGVLALRGAQTGALALLDATNGPAAATSFGTSLRAERLRDIMERDADVARTASDIRVGLAAVEHAPPGSLQAELADPASQSRATLTGYFEWVAAHRPGSSAAQAGL